MCHSFRRTLYSAVQFTQLAVGPVEAGVTAGASVLEVEVGAVASVQTGAAVAFVDPCKLEAVMG